MPTRRDDAGTVLLWTIGSLIVALLAVLICVDVGSLIQQQYRLELRTDAAALAAINNLDLDRFLVTGNPTDAVIDPVTARAAAVEQLQPFGIQVVSLSASARMLTLETSRQWRPPFSALVTTRVILHADTSVTLDMLG